jgi:ATP-binding cassette subfamily C protein LapB
MLDIVDRMLVMDYGRLLVDGPKEAVLEKLKTGITAKA